MADANHNTPVGAPPLLKHWCPECGAIEEVTSAVDSLMHRHDDENKKKDPLKTHVVILKRVTP